MDIRKILDLTWMADRQVANYITFNSLVILAYKKIVQTFMGLSATTCVLVG